MTVTLEVARAEAESICGMLRDACDDIEIAGSVRRRRPYVGDIDLVAIPQLKPGAPLSLFGDPEVVNLLEQRLEELRREGLLTVIRNGDKMKRLAIKGSQLQIDLYVASRDNWATLLLIRTGSQAHNIHLCTMARTRGMQLKADGSGLLRDGHIVASGSEEEIFHALGLDYRPPEQREWL